MKLSQAGFWFFLGALITAFINKDAETGAVALLVIIALSLANHITKLIYK